MGFLISSIFLVLVVTTYARDDMSRPPCRYNCPDAEKLVCATLNGENRTFANRCQLDLHNCLTRTKWQVVKKGICENEIRNE